MPWERDLVFRPRPDLHGSGLIRSRLANARRYHDAGLLNAAATLLYFRRHFDFAGIVWSHAARWAWQWGDEAAASGYLRNAGQVALRPEVRDMGDALRSWKPVDPPAEWVRQLREICVGCGKSNVKIDAIGQVSICKLCLEKAHHYVVWVQERGDWNPIAPCRCVACGVRVTIRFARIRFGWLCVRCIEGHLATST